MFGRVNGGAKAILRAERVVLNFLQRMSGIATATAMMVAACDGTKAQVCLHALRELMPMRRNRLASGVGDSESFANTYGLPHFTCATVP